MRAGGLAAASQAQSTDQVVRESLAASAATLDHRAADLFYGTLDSAVGNPPQDRLFGDLL